MRCLGAAYCALAIFMRTLIIIAFAFLLAYALPASSQTSNADCLACHDNPELTKDVGGRTVSVYADRKKLAASVHGPLDCTNCHADVTGYPHEPSPKAVACASCHPDSVAAWEWRRDARSTC